MIADHESIPLSQAHLLVGVARATVYRWHNEGRLTAYEEGDIGKGLKLYVRAGEIRELHTRMRKLRHAAKRIVEPE